jgi:tetratricopeptide (TPR) repeat protein
MNKSHFFTLCAGLLLSQLLHAANLRPEVPDPESVQAYSQFWRSFDDYENHRRNSEQSQKMGAWDQIRQEFSFQDGTARDRELDLLQEAAARYQNHLESHPDAGNAPYVKLNLAQIQANIASLRDEQSPKSGDKHRKTALTILAEISKEHPGFVLQEEAQYLRATLLEGLGQNESAFTIWLSLAAKARHSIFGVHAFLAVGDHYFAKEKPQDALKAYRKGRGLLDGLEVKDKDIERLRFQYRMAWAAYRSAELDQCIATTVELLEPGHEFRNLRVKQKVESDAVELAGDALFEKDDMATIRSTLQNKLIRAHAAAIGLRIMNRQMGLENKEKLLEIGPFLVENYPKAKEMPDILMLLANVYKEQKQQDRYLATLERLSLLLPGNSLWRNHQQSEPLVIQNMEEKSLAATQLLAAQSYEQGMVQGSPASFKTALTYYENLIRSKPQHAEAETWKLRRAHCFYFSEQWAEADKAYEQFKSERQVTAPNLELASYQQILAREKIWRQSLQKTVSNRGTPGKDPLVVEKLRKLEQGIDEFADRFPGRPHSVDLLLLAASANRDLNNYEEAEKYWSRSLLSSPSPGQRTLAIRGLVQARIKNGSPQDIVALTRNFLKLEDWNELGSGFGGELKGVLSAAAKDAGENLNKKGEVTEAGRMLLGLAEEFPDLPDYDSIYRDGAYYLAIGGAWNEALKASEQYLAKNDRAKAADMIYLKARSQEYQMRFRDAAQTHLALVERFPRYARSSGSIQRAEDLAIAEDEYRMAGRAAMLAVQYQKNLDGRYGAYVRASRHYKQTQAWDQALLALQEAQKISRQPGTKLKTKTEIARLMLAKGDRDEAANIYRQLAQETSRRQENIDKATFQAISGEANFQLAEFERQNFEAIAAAGDEGIHPEKSEEKALRLERSLNYYAKAIATQDPEWATRARYGAGQTAERMSQSLRHALARRDRSQDSESRTLQDQAQRWQSLAQEYFSQNLLVRNKEPHRYKDSVWVEKSALKLSGMATGAPKTEEKTEVPASVGTSTPYMWSH